MEKPYLKPPQSILSILSNYAVGASMFHLDAADVVHEQAPSMFTTNILRTSSFNKKLSIRGVVPDIQRFIALQNRKTTAERVAIELHFAFAVPCCDLVALILF